MSIDGKSRPFSREISDEDWSRMMSGDVLVRAVVKDGVKTVYSAGEYHPTWAEDVIMFQNLVENGIGIPCKPSK